MNNRLYGNLIFELSRKGRKGYSLPKADYSYSTSDLPQNLLRQNDAALPECDELTVVRHYTNLSLYHIISVCHLLVDSCQDTLVYSS